MAPVVSSAPPLRDRGSVGALDVRLVVIGDSNVGKTSLLDCFVNGASAVHSEITLGTDVYVCPMEVDGRQLRLQVFVLPGDDRIATHDPYYDKADGAMILFDITAADSFKNVTQWLRKVPLKVPTVLVGNKCDLADRRQVDTSAAEAFAVQHRLLHVETSAKTDQNVHEAFQQLCRVVYLLSLPGKSNGACTNEECSCKCAVM